jgi:hypothetical protein
MLVLLACSAGLTAAAALASTRHSLEESAALSKPAMCRTCIGMRTGEHDFACKCTCICASLANLCLVEAFQAGTCAGLQLGISQKQADRRHTQHLTKYEAITQDSPEFPRNRSQPCTTSDYVAQRAAQCSYSMAQHHAHKGSWEIDNSTVKAALNFQLGVSVRPSEHTYTQVHLWLKRNSLSPCD